MSTPSEKAMELASSIYDGHRSTLDGALAIDALVADARAEAMEECEKLLVEHRAAWAIRIQRAQWSDRDELGWVKSGITLSIAAIKALAAKGKA